MPVQPEECEPPPATDGQQKNIDFLRQLELFAGLPEDDLERLCEMSENVAIPPGEYLMREGDPGGSLVGVASLAGIEGAARNEAYSATKGAVLAMMRSIAVEHARFGVRANAIAPGWIATDMTAGAQSNQTFKDKVMVRVPMRRWGTPQDFGGIAVYLASDASKYHTGDTFVIDGGYLVF